MKVITLNKFELFATKLALDGAADGFFVTNPTLIRSKALELLNAVGVKVAPKAKWTTLAKVFNTTFGSVLN